MRIRGALFFCIGLLILSLITGCCTNNAGDDSSHDGTARLIVATIDDSDEENRSQALLEYEFLNGELVSTQTILTNQGGQLRFTCDESYLVQDRYVVTDFGDIVDIQSGEFIHYGGSGSDYTRLVSIEGDNVIIETPQTGEYSYYNLSTREYKEIEDPGKWELPGILSPDGSKSVQFNSGSNGCGEIRMYSLTGEEMLLGSGFCIQVSGLSSVAGMAVPMIWIDNDTIVTQRSNGEIVTVTIDGVIEPIVNISLKAEGDPDWWTSGYGAGVLGASLETDSAGNIIYTVHYPWVPDQEPGANSKSFVIDIKDKTDSTYDPEWVDLGNGFEAENIPDDGYRSIRYNGTDIGREWFHPRESVTMEGYLATTYYDELLGNPCGVKVWSSANEMWTTIDIEPPIWLSDTSIIGWIQQ